MDLYAIMQQVLVCLLCTVLHHFGTEWYRRQFVVSVDFQTIDGEVHRIDVYIASSVKELKATVGNHLNLDSGTLSLYHNKKLLENNDPLDAHRLEKDPIVRVLSGGQFRFWVRRLSFEEEMWYAADQNTTVGDVKVMIRDSDSFPIDVELGLVSNICRYRQDLWFRGERLSDKLKLVDVGMKDESKMLLVMVACSTELF